MNNASDNSVYTQANVHKNISGVIREKSYWQIEINLLVTFQNGSRHSYVRDGTVEWQEPLCWVCKKSLDFLFSSVISSYKNRTEHFITGCIPQTVHRFRWMSHVLFPDNYFAIRIMTGLPMKMKQQEHDWKKCDQCIKPSTTDKLVFSWFP